MTCRTGRALPRSLATQASRGAGECTGDGDKFDKFADPRGREYSAYAARFDKFAAR